MQYSWRPDILPGFEATDLELVPDRAPGEDVDPVATLVRRVRRAGAAPLRAAVLYLHGWNDYFFQLHLADYWLRQGHQFYALDLRRYGRSLRPTQLPGFITDLEDYGEELGAAMAEIDTEHDRVVLMAHSTGGLVGALWADAHHDRLAGIILNSPWLDLQGAPIMRSLGTLVEAVGARAATAVIRLPDPGLYARALHTEHGGEWDYDTDLKMSPSPPVRAGWVRAVLRGHHAIARGLSLPMPVLVMCSDKTQFRRRWTEELRRVDSVLDVEQIAARAPRLGRCVTIVRIAGGVHDLVLSAPPVRAAVFDEIDRWSDGYLRET